MNASLVIMSVLFFSSAIMCFVMALAWKHFGRQRHVLLWSVAYGVAVLRSVVSTGGILLKSPLLLIIATACVILSASLVAFGARQRTGRAVRIGPFLVGGGLALVGAAIAHSYPDLRVLQRAIPSCYAGVMMAVAANAIWPRGRPFRAPELAFFSALVLFTLFLSGLIGIAIGFGAEDAEAGAHLFRTFLAIGLPSIYVATGVTAILLVAGDLATQLRQLVSNDQLTGLLNRRGIDEAGARAIANARRHGRNIAAVICDMDSFKAVNDGHGHIVGDAALRAFSRVLLSAVRQEDICARFGGDEFCVLLLDASEQDAADVMERVRSGIELLAIDRMEPGSISASFGITSLQVGDSSLDDLIARADRALYQSKQGGRNRVTVWRDTGFAPEPALV
ncbi:GGDEF domain-containing protein [Sphingobium sp. SCG-1]|uniref:GGDEF domain-containing protein n=1 Tax=Sphingobium sp. SCG-1 TaxID=2072936 RepID=UPI000CD69C41|nr:GGDEF domain-containing protein [Sphingobium sp. SCG-1]AUW60229.1 GGDEF domain-containing protein [Sphingobium sp. SCG-1]